MKKQSVEMEKVAIELPKAVMDYLRRAESSVKGYIENSLLQIIKSDLDAFEGEWPPGPEIRPILEAAVA